jgi:hypothetical protein
VHLGRWRAADEGAAAIAAEKFREAWEMAGGPCHLDTLTRIKWAAEDDSEDAAPPLVIDKEKRHDERGGASRPNRAGLPREIMFPNLDATIERLAALLPDAATRPLFKAEVLALFEKAAGITVPANDSAKRPPRPQWEKDARPDETPAHFAHRAGYVHRGMISTEDRALHKKLFNWLRTHKWPADVPYIPTLPEWNERKAAKLPELLATLGIDIQEVHRLEAVARRVVSTRGERIPGM